MATSGDALAAHVFEIMLLPILQIQRATIAIVHCGRDVGSQLLLQHQPHAVCLKIASLIGECSRINVRQYLAIDRGKFTDAGECRVTYPV